MSRLVCRASRVAILFGLAGALGCATASDDVGTNNGAHDTGTPKDAGGGDTSNGGGDTGDARVDSGTFGDSGAIDSTLDDTGVDLDSGIGADTGIGVDTAVADTGALDTGAIDTGTDTFTPPPDTGFDAGSDATTGCTLVEGFESGGFGASWVDVSGGTSGTFSAASAHDGSFGWGNSGTSDWLYVTSPVVGASGDRLTAWVRGGSGRIYLGFSASASGAKSFVFAPNTGDIRFQDNTAWGFTEMTSTPVSIAPAHWYKMEIVFGGGSSVTGNLYDSDGTTLVATVSQTYGSLASGGVALRAFGVTDSSDVDTVEFCRGP